MLKDRDARINDCTMTDTENSPVVSSGIPFVIQKGLEHNSKICSLAPLRAAAVRTDGPSQYLLCPMQEKINTSTLYLFTSCRFVFFFFLLGDSARNHSNLHSHLLTVSSPSYTFYIYRRIFILILHLAFYLAINLPGTAT